jgi:hypothetical protein
VETEDTAGRRETLGGTPEPRVQRYFCVEDEACHGFARISHDAKVLKRTPKTVSVKGRDVAGWIVELEVPATDGIVRIDPLSDGLRSRQD